MMTGERLLTTFKLAELNYSGMVNSSTLTNKQPTSTTNQHQPQLLQINLIQYTFLNLYSL
jgi:hypothetical protein